MERTPNEQFRILVAVVQLEQREYYRLVTEMLAMSNLAIEARIPLETSALLDTLQKSVERMKVANDELDKIC